MGEWPRYRFNPFTSPPSVCKYTHPNQHLTLHRNMGGSSSKEQDATQEVATQIDTSSGFPLIEIHMPTAGMGIGLIVMILLICCCCFPIVRRTMSLWKRLQRVEHDGQQVNRAPQIVVIPQPGPHIRHLTEPASSTHGVADIQVADDDDEEPQTAGRSFAASTSTSCSKKHRGQVHWGPRSGTQ